MAKTTAAQRKAEMRRELDLLGKLIELETKVDYLLASKAAQQTEGAQDGSEN